MELSKALLIGREEQRNKEEGYKTIVDNNYTIVGFYRRFFLIVCTINPVVD